MLYISNSISYKPRNDLNIYKTKELESVFVESLLDNKKTIVGCIYRHPCMSLNEFNLYYLEPLLEKVSKENKNIILLGDFNADILQPKKDSAIQDFLNILSSHYFFSYIKEATRVTPHSKTLIDNIFLNVKSESIISGIFTIDISDHFSQFLFLPKSNCLDNKEKMIFRNFKNFNEKEFLRCVSLVEWEKTIEINKNDPNVSIKLFLNQINTLLDKYAPFKSLSRSKKKLSSKPWITRGILNSIRIKDNKIYRKILRLKNPNNKLLLRKKFNKYRNLINKLLYISKKMYYEKTFEECKNDTKKSWELVGNIINKTNNLSQKRNVQIVL